MKPIFVIAALIIRFEAKSIARDGECTMLSYFTEKSLELGGLRNRQTSVQLFGMDRGSHRGEQPGVSKAQSIKAAPVVLRLFLLRQSNTVQVKSPATKSTS